MTQARLHTLLGLLSLAMLGLGYASWQLSPDKLALPVMGIGTMLGIWVVVAWLLRIRPLSAYGPFERRYFVACALAAGVLLVLSMGYRVAEAAGIEMQYGPQGLGLLGGLLLVAVGNFMPKALRPLTGSHSAVRSQSVQRFAGWAFVLGGLAYLAAWIGLPTYLASMVSSAICLVCVLLVALQWARSSTQARGSPLP